MNEKMYAYIVVRNDGEDPVAYVSNDKQKAFNHASLFHDAFGEKMFEVTNLFLSADDLSSFCFVEFKNGIPYQIFHNNCEDDAKYVLCNYVEV